jgi:hypothetical protein
LTPSATVEGVSSPDYFPPAPEGGELIHTRFYEARTYKMSDDLFLLRGVVCDEKPAGLYMAGDPDPLWVHHMVVDLEISFPMFVIQKVSVTFHERPHTHCTDIEPDYQKLVGLSIARGFNKQVKDLFGGPRGCTHIGALLAAMAPVAIQSGWSMRMGNALGNEEFDSATTAEQRKRSYAMNLNTCHMWDENGQMVTDIEAGLPMEIPLWITKRAKKLGRDESEWLKRRE